MSGTTHDETPESRTRHIGPLGTAARTAVGLAMLGSVVQGHVSGPFRPLAWVLGLLAFPLATLAWHRWRIRRAPGRPPAGGVIGLLGGPAVFLALYLTWWYAPALDVTSDAVLLFYGGSMLLAAARGSPGCEVLAFSNWVLGRDDAPGCFVFEPLDRRPRRNPTSITG